MTASALLDGALRPLDRVRGGVLRVLAGVPPLRPALVRRGTRVPVMLSMHALAAFALALLAPSLLLVLGPLVLGVPHVVSDVRHLVLRRALPRWWLAAIAALGGALVVGRLLAEAGVLRQQPLRLENAVGCFWILLGAAGGAMAARARAVAADRTAAAPVAAPVKVRRSRRRPIALAFVLAGAVAIPALAKPELFRLGLTHGHNLVAVALWLALFWRRRGPLAWLVLALVTAGGGLLASGALLGVTLRHGALSCFGLHLFAATDAISPGLPDAPAVALTTAYAFLQSVHYAIWLVAIPQSEGRAEGSRTLRMSLRGLVRDLTPTGLAAAAALAAIVLTAGALHPLRTRAVYLSLVTFHVWLELALLAFFVARGSGGASAAGAPASVAGTRTATAPRAAA